MNRLISPPLDAHANLRQPLEPGERAVLDLFCRHLAPEWEIYIQPHLNGLRPDFVLLNPKVGIAVFEVKDWNLDAIRYNTRENKVGQPELWGSGGGRNFSLEKQNPFTKIRTYKEEIFNLYCPRLQQKAGFAAITGGVIFPFADARQVRKLQEPFLSEDERKYAESYLPVSGRNELELGCLETIFPESTRKYSKLMTGELAADLRGWLCEPDFSETQRQPLELDANQRQLAETRTESGYRRIKGPAGSGKSLVLAARAANLMNEGKSVLIATYNITLWHYLRDLVVRGLKRPGLFDRAVFTNFHRWCKSVCIEADLREKYDELFSPVHQIESRVREIEKSRLAAERKAELIKPLRKQHSQLLKSIMNIELPDLASRAAASPDVTRYDAILVDEGQDYLPAWWNAMRKCCAPGGEMLLVADATQDVYGTARSWTDEAMTGAGFPGGRWAQLRVSYRLPPEVLRLARDFAVRYLPNETMDLPESEQGTLDLFPCKLRWVQCHPGDAPKQCVDAIQQMMLETGKANLANADITFLAEDIEFGKYVTDQLETHHIRTIHTFEKDRREQSRRKMGFFMGDARIKATTLHSFKGWESRLVVVHAGSASSAESLALIYAGLTRLKRSQNGSCLTVVCSAPELREFGTTWQNFQEKRSPVALDGNPYLKALEDVTKPWTTRGSGNTGER